MNWLDEGALFSQIGAFLSEDLGRGDITTQSTVARNTRARGRFLAKEPMVVAGLEAAEAVFSTLDAQQQIEAFASDGDEVESGKVIARTSGFADVLLAGERLALNLMQRLSGIATLTRKYVRAVEGTGAQIVDTRKTTPGLRMLEKYAVLSGGGRNHRFGLDDGVLIKDNHIALAGGVGAAVGQARAKVGHLHKIEVEVSAERELREALQEGADIILLDNLSPEETARMVTLARELDPKVTLESSGGITLETVRAYAEAGVDLISIGALTHSARAMDISFKIQAG
ncbi:MAG TPA: carboxylating nicotinate-nucleotide diphosphorylase [Pyrinomonadaceae bacterium]|jgi:nicotinate-nucleotide pyrophosphorylase (carboxylating)|nr:carboxylating nicotinate-nucleotide diphosphorylase [Pyrinomonadaceae bacterium]